MKIKRIQLKHDILRYVGSSQCLIFEWVPYPRVNTLLSHIKSFQKFTGSPWWYIKNTFIRLILAMYFQSNSRHFNLHPDFWFEKSRFVSNPRKTVSFCKLCPKWSTNPIAITRIFPHRPTRFTNIAIIIETPLCDRNCSVMNLIHQNWSSTHCLGMIFKSTF